MPKAEPIRSMFNNIAHSYDLLNDLLSLGIHRIWKKKLINSLTEVHPTSMLDCATGTGDIALSFLQENPAARVVGTDFSANMLEIAKKKSDDIRWEVQDVTHLPYQAREFDVSAISYGIRNVENMEQGLREMARVTSKRICILEFGQPENPLLRSIYFGIMKLFIPLMGLIFNKKQAYKYLIDSSMTFPSGDKMVEVIKANTHFEKVVYHPIMGGITYLYIASNNE